MIDIHCHILPGLDDGPSSLETSLEMAAVAAQDGIKVIIATPHTDGIRIHSVLVQKSVKHLNTALRDKKIDITIHCGYEIPSYLLDNLATAHTLAGSSYLLVEFPHTHLPADALSTISTAVSRGFHPIIAHPERNPDVLNNPELLRNLTDNGALTQLTAASVVGELGPDILHCSHYLIKNNMVHFIATDSHSPSFRKPVLSKAHKIATKLVGKEQADQLVLHNGSKIIHPPQN